MTSDGAGRGGLHHHNVYLSNTILFQPPPLSSFRQHSLSRRLRLPRPEAPECRWWWGADQLLHIIAYLECAQQPIQINSISGEQRERIEN